MMTVNLRKINRQIKPGSVFAVIGGTHKANFIVCVDEYPDSYGFLFLPNLEAHHINSKDVVDGIKTKILDLIEILPPDVFTICKAQYEKNINS